MSDKALFTVWIVESKSQANEVFRTALERMTGVSLRVFAESDVTKP